MVYLVLVSDDAERDFIEAFDWYEMQRKGLGSELELCIEARLNGIARNPFGYQLRYKDVHVAFVERFPYGIHYLIDGHDIQVIGIFHMSRNPTRWDES